MSVWANKQFSRFYAAFSLTALGDWFDIFALQIIFVKIYHASPLMISALVLSYFLPGMLFGSVVGCITDKYGKRQLMVIADSLSCILTLALFVSSHAGAALLLVFMRSSLGTINQAVVNAYIKNNVEEQHLLKATSYLSMAFQLSKVLGPVIGASLLVVISPQQCIVINAISFALSTAIMLSIAADKPVRLVAQVTSMRMIDKIVEGFKALRKQPALLMLMAISFFWFMTSIASISQMSIYLTHLLPHHLSSLGYIIGLDGLGAVLASVVLSRLKDIESYFSFMTIGFLLMIVGLSSFALFQPSWSISILYVSAFVFGIGSSVNILVYTLMIRKLSPAHCVGRVSSLFLTVQNTAQLIGTVGAGFVVTTLGVRSLYELLTSMLALLLVGALWFTSNKRLHKLAS